MQYSIFNVYAFTWLVWKDLMALQYHCQWMQKKLQRNLPEMCPNVSQLIEVPFEKLPPNNGSNIESHANAASSTPSSECGNKKIVNKELAAAIVWFVFNFDLLIVSRYRVSNRRLNEKPIISYRDLPSFTYIYNGRTRSYWWLLYEWT